MVSEKLMCVDIRVLSIKGSHTVVFYQTHAMFRVETNNELMLKLLNIAMTS